MKLTKDGRLIYSTQLAMTRIDKLVEVAADVVVII